MKVSKVRQIAQTEAALAVAYAPRPKVDTHNHVTINQQPHDAADAARLLGELEDKAEARILESIKVGNTEFECVVQSWHEAASDTMKYRAVFKLNGRKMKATFETDCRPRGDGDPIVKAANGLRDEIAKEIATQIIGPAFEAMMRSGRYGQ